MVQYWLYWRSLEDEGAFWGDYEGGDSGWIEDTEYTVEGLKDGITYAFYVYSRDRLMHYSEESEHVYATVDLSPPVIEIETPIQDEVHSGTITINGTFNESTPVFFTVLHYSADAAGYIYVRDPQTILEWGLFSISWDTTQVPDGVTYVKVIVNDALDRQAQAKVGITIRNGKPLVPREEIRFSDTEPLMGEVVTVMVKVRNEGGRAVEDLRLEVYDRGEILFVEPSVTVGPHSENVYWFQMRVVWEHNITARAFSDLYDTGEMEIGVKLEGREETTEEVEERPVEWFAILAIVLAVTAIALNLVGRRTTVAEVPKESEEDLRVGSREEQEKGPG